MDETAALLTERGKTHGRFEDHARCTVRLMEVICGEAKLRPDRSQKQFTNEQFQALHMICDKIGRILAGDANFADHWDDIAGYAKLCSKEPAYEETAAGAAYGKSPAMAALDEAKTWNAKVDHLREERRWKDRRTETELSNGLIRAHAGLPLRRQLDRRKPS